MDNKQSEHGRRISRKGFLQASALAAGAAFMPNGAEALLTDFPSSERLGRIAVGMVDIKAKPDYFDETIVGRYYEDAVIPWYREVIGPWPWRNVQRWVETEEGFVWGPYVQPVKNEPNQPIEAIPEGAEGMWVEVTVPWVNATLENPEPFAYWWYLRVDNKTPLRFYYSQVLWVDRIKEDYDGTILYRINERYGNPGDLLWAPGEAFRPISEDEVAPISPNVENKQIVVDVALNRQTLSCFEDGREVYFCRISSGKAPYTTELSPYGTEGHHIWRKLYSLQMAGGSYDFGWTIPGVGWTSLFIPGGVAIHSTFWHNNYGEPSSHGCINVSPEDAKWIFRWTNPIVPYPKGDIEVQGKIGTPVKVIEY